jgi:hypothetical protein
LTVLSFNPENFNQIHLLLWIVRFASPPLLPDKVNRPNCRDERDLQSDPSARRLTKNEGRFVRQDTLDITICAFQTWSRPDGFEPTAMSTNRPERFEKDFDLESPALQKSAQSLAVGVQTSLITTRKAVPTLPAGTDRYVEQPCCPGFECGSAKVLSQRVLNYRTTLTSEALNGRTHFNPHSIIAQECAKQRCRRKECYRGPVTDDSASIRKVLFLEAWLHRRNEAVF